MLRESEAYVSGQQICEKFGVSRTAVWKVISQLKDEGYEVEAVRNKGYHIVSAPDVITEEEMQSLLAEKTAWAGQKVFGYKEIDSTNIQAKRLGEERMPHGTLVIADKQSDGRGRRGKNWTSPPGENIYMTLLLRPEFEPTKAPMLTLVMAHSVAKALKKATDLDVQIKWPNDIIFHGKKLVGILTEMSTEIEYINHVVIGVGINTNLCEFPEEIKSTATSLRIELGKKVKRASIIVEVMKQFEQDYGQFLKDGDLSGIREEYNRLLVNRDREVRVLGAECPYKAVARGINHTGELLIEKEDGTKEAVYAGEVSVRGVYGYV